MNATEKLVENKIKNKKKLNKLKEKKYPLQYILGNTNFYGYLFLVNKNVLIPRFETEGLIEETIKLLKKLKLTKIDILDLGTGSGCIAITLAKETNPKQVDALDISGKALKLAKKNAKINNVTINFIHKDIKKYKPNKKYDLIISNPPYLTKNDDVDKSIMYEPKRALYAEDEGLEYYKVILKNYKNNLKKKSIMAFEIGEKQSDYLLNYAKKFFPKAQIEVKKDLAKKIRYLFIINE